MEFLIVAPLPPALVREPPFLECGWSRQQLISEPGVEDPDGAESKQSKQSNVTLKIIQFHTDIKEANFIETMIHDNQDFVIDQCMKLDELTLAL